MSSAPPFDFKWPRTDGDKSRWPATGRGIAGSTWYEELGTTDKKYALYEKKIAELLLEKGHKVPAGECPEAFVVVHPLGGRGSADTPGRGVKLPNNYRLFVHFQPQKDGSVREDVYVYGSTNANRVRTVGRLEILPYPSV
jgi:hypothetical protein